MVKSYSRYEAQASFGVISSNSNVAWLAPQSSASATSSGRAVVGGLEQVLIWDIKTNTLLSRLQEPNVVAEVCYVDVDPTGQLIASGYSDGSIRVWDVQSGTIIVTFNGHKSAISVLTFDKSGTRLASGSRDSNIVIWDLIGEVGLYRLRSHRDQVTSIQFLDTDNDRWILSVAKDGLIKLWDLEVQQCIETHVAHRGECWSMGIEAEDSVADEDSEQEQLVQKRFRVLTSGTTKDIKFWSVDVAKPDGLKVAEVGTLMKQSGERGIAIKFHPSQQYFAIANADKSVEVWRKRTASEVKRSVQRKQKRRKEKGLEPDESISEDSVDEQFIPYTIIRTPARVRGFDWTQSNTRLKSQQSLELLVTLSNNSIEYYNVVTDSEVGKKKSAGPAEYSRVYSMEQSGHRSDIRSLAVSSDNKMVVSASNGSLKLWNVKTTNCLRSFDSGYVLCSSFLPGDAMIVTGTKDGALTLYDVASSSVHEEIADAHEGAVWSLDISADGKTLITGSADKTVKFWEFRVEQEEVPGTSRTVSRLKLKHTRTLELSDDVLAVKLSADSKLIAASLLDNTVKVFFVDTLKFFLSLYGHKLPVLSLDISHDSKLLVTCSADKNIKIWGLDFGDCHRSIFAHQDSIMKVVFEPGTHNIFSASKDKTVKYWDGDKFELVLTLSGHHSEVWALAIANDASFIISGSHDKSIRVWELTDDPVFLVEEREKELEEIYEANLASSLEAQEEPQPNEDEEPENVEKAGKQTMETLKAGERLMEAIDIGSEDLKQIREHKQALLLDPSAPKPTRNIILQALGMTAEEYVMDILRKIKASQLEDALLVFPFDRVVALFQFIEIWVARRWNIPLVCRVLFFTLGVHHKQIVAYKVMRPNLEAMKDFLDSALHLSQDQIGYNIAGLKFLKQNWEVFHTKEFVDESEHQQETDRQLKKRAFTTV